MTRLKPSRGIYFAGAYELSNAVPELTIGSIGTRIHTGSMNAMKTAESLENREMLLRPG
jgi:hypothetical protein